MTLQRKADHSPFFARQVRTPLKSISRTTSSNHFIKSPSSSFGSLQHHSLLESITPPGQSGGKQSVLDQFKTCNEFIKTYEQSVTSKNEEARILASVRHLCPHACYLRAFAPTREWHYLRKAILENADKSPDEILQGWCCRLLPRSPDETIRPSAKVCFYSPDGKVFASKVAVLRELGVVGKEFAIKSRVGADLEVNVVRKRRAPPENIREVVDAPNQRKQYCPPTILKDVTSPFGLLEELFHDDPWRLLISTIFLNRTSRVQVDIVLHAFFARWPSPESVVDAQWDDISKIIAPLGIRHRRARGLIRFSRDYLKKMSKSAGGTQRCTNTTMTREDVLSLFHCGEYAYDAYHIFIQRNISSLAADHALQDYIEYQRGVLDSTTTSLRMI